MCSIVHVASEFAPLAKAGGMGDAVFGLAKEQQRQGIKVALFLPFYACISLAPSQKDIVETPFGPIVVYRTTFEGFSLFLVDHPTFFAHERLYGGSDETERFLFFTLAAAYAIQQWVPSSVPIQCHDWHAASVPLFLKGYRTLLTLHNLNYLGWGDKRLLRKYHLEPYQQFLLHGDAICLMQGGLLVATILVAVSPTYAKEILSSPLGGPLHAILRKRTHDLHGILNGIDQDAWNPATDSCLEYPFTASTCKVGKWKNRLALQRAFHLNAPKGPLFACITRFDPQKGPDLIVFGMEKVVREGGQFFFLGSATHPDCDILLQALKKKYATHRDIAIYDGFNEKLSRQVYASADFLLVPSIFEPCGLTQLIAMRYGTLPIVRRTGGLSDTVVDGADGFVFEKAAHAALGEAIDRAIHCFQGAHFEEMRALAMRRNFSWEKAAKQYARLVDLCLPQ